MCPVDDGLKGHLPPLSEADKALYNKIDEETTRFLRTRYNRITRWVITSTGQVGGVTKSVQIVFAANPPEAFSNTLSIGGDMTVEGYKATVNILDKARLGGKVQDNFRI